MSAEERDIARTAFAELLPNLLSNALAAFGQSDGSWVRGVAEELEALGESLQIDVRDSVHEILEHADQIEGPEPDGASGRRGGPAGGSEHGLSSEEIDRMFEGLRGD